MPDSGQSLPSSFTARDTAQVIAASGTLNGATHDAGEFAAGSPQPNAIQWQITATGTSPDCDLYVQHSIDGTNWTEADLIYNIDAALTDKLLEIPLRQRYQRLYYSNNNASNSITITSESAEVIGHYATS